jgi:two-component system, cell cycle sensor histidine kinase and response regulator CckA
MQTTRSNGVLVTSELLQRHSDKRFQALIELLPYGIVVIDANGQVQLMSQEAGVFFEGEELLHSDLLKSKTILAAGLSAQVTQLIQDQVDFTTQVEHSSVDDDGRTFDIRGICTGSNQRNAQEYLLLIHDQTDLLQLSGEKKKLQAQLLTSQRMESFGLLAAGIAHDLNNVLTSVLGASELLQAYCGEQEQVVRLTDQIINAADQGARMTRKVLRSANTKEDNDQPVQLNQVVEDVIMLLRRSVDPRIAIECSKCDGPLTTSSDSTLLHQVMMNLCVNARDAIEGSGRLDVHIGRQTYRSFLDGEDVGRAPDLKLVSEGLDLAEDAPLLVLEVRDTGGGIPPAVLPHILDPFYTTKPKDIGTGLGLSIVAQAVEIGNFLFTVHTEADVGTRMRVACVPLDSRAAMPAPTKAPHITGSGTGRVLVVDDEKVVRQTLSEMLEMLGYETVCAENGRVALELYEEYGMDMKLIVLDLMMPEIDGIETLRRIQALVPEQPVVVVTGYANEEIIADLQNQAGVPVLLKPFRYSELIEQLELLDNPN